MKCPTFENNIEIKPYISPKYKIKTIYCVFLTISNLYSIIRIIIQKK